MKSVKSFVSLMFVRISFVFSFFNSYANLLSKCEINHDLKDMSQLRSIITSCFISKIKLHSHLSENSRIKIFFVSSLKASTNVDRPAAILSEQHN